MSDRIVVPKEGRSTGLTDVPIVDVLVETADAILIPRLEHRRWKGMLHPSSASIVMEDENFGSKVVGTCLRRAYWTFIGEERDPPPTDPEKIQRHLRYARLAHYGSYLANAELDLLEKSGICVVAREYEIVDPKWRLHGHVDAVAVDPTDRHNIGLEYKSVGSSEFRYVRKAPKIEALLQVMVYASELVGDIDDWRIIYICREPKLYDPVEYRVRLLDNGVVSVDGQIQDGITIQRIFSRYAKLLMAVKQGELPDRDYEIQYSGERLDIMSRLGMLGKNQKKELALGRQPKVGDWQCRFCPYSNRCWDAI